MTTMAEMDMMEPGSVASDRSLYRHREYSSSEARRTGFARCAHLGTLRNQSKFRSLLLNPPLPPAMVTDPVPQQEGRSTEV
jgi:hypothetical protein